MDGFNFQILGVDRQTCMVWGANGGMGSWLVSRSVASGGFFYLFGTFLDMDARTPAPPPSLCSFHCYPPFVVPDVRDIIHHPPLQHRALHPERTSLGPPLVRPSHVLIPRLLLAIPFPQQRQPRACLVERNARPGQSVEEIGPVAVAVVGREEGAGFQDGVRVRRAGGVGG